MLRYDELEGDDPLAGAGTVAFLPAGVDPSAFSGVRLLPEGIYLCCSRWGMPYDPQGAREFIGHAKGHGLRVLDDVCDLCLMDTVSYNEEHRVDFCCLQAPVAL